MERVFPWFSVKKSRFWEPNKVSSKWVNSVITFFLIRNLSFLIFLDGGFILDSGLFLKINQLNSFLLLV